MTTNEAAERLLRFLEPEDRIHAKTLLDAALAAERKTTVERIREALWSNGVTGLSVDAILDAASGDWDAEAIVREITEAAR